MAELRRLRILEEENRKLKQLVLIAPRNVRVADLSLDKAMLQEVITKKLSPFPSGGYPPTQKRALVRFLQVGFQVSERRACRLVKVSRSLFRYRSRAKDQAVTLVRSAPCVCAGESVTSPLPGVHRAARLASALRLSENPDHASARRLESQSQTGLSPLQTGGS